MTKKRIGKGILIVLMILIATSRFAFPAYDARITIIVTDEDSNPIENARVGVGFLKTSGWKSTENPVVGYTDHAGRFSAQSETDEKIGFNVKKDDYYMNIVDYEFKKIKQGRWQPWNPEIRTILRRMMHPVPMFARNTSRSEMIIPEIEKPVGFDLTAFDWVSPHGTGIHSDLIFLLNGTYSGYDDFDMTLEISFSNKYDGIQVAKDEESRGSIFKLARYAPTGNYQGKMMKFHKAKHKGAIENNFDDTNNYYFRVRSEVKDKRLDRAMYGKILGDIKFYPKSPRSANLVFKYYLNPDYTRNLEYDPMQNLFLDLRDRRKLEFVDLF